MSLNHLSNMRKSPGLIARITACVAKKGEPNPEQWVVTHLWELVVDEDWIAAWAFAEENKNMNVNQDTGQRDDVIPDSMIDSGVEAIINPLP